MPAFVRRAIRLRLAAAAVVALSVTTALGACTPEDAPFEPTQVQAPEQVPTPEAVPEQTPEQMPTQAQPTPEPSPEVVEPELAILDAAWVDRSDGPSLFVTPAEWVRTGGYDAWEEAMRQLAGLHPEADSDSMRNQFLCHAIGAPDKPTWNLEPWRENIGLGGFALARCNP